MDRNTRYRRWLLLVALEQELFELTSIITDFQQSEWRQHLILQGKIQSAEVLATVTGVGKVHAAMVTQHWIDTYQPEAVLVLGLAGSLDPRVKQKDIVIGQTLIQHDVISNPQFPAHHIPRPDRKTLLYAFHSDQQLVKQATQFVGPSNGHLGTILTGDHFLANKKQLKLELAEQFQAVAVDMESAAIAQVCTINQIPFLVVKIISDSADDRAVVDFQDFLPSASKQITQFVSTFFRRLK